MYLQAMLVRRSLVPFITLKLLKLTLSHGLSLLAPVAFSTYGILCFMGLRDVASALRFGELGIGLLETVKVKEYLPRVNAAFYGCLHHWKRPLREALPHLLHGYEVGRVTGDMECSSLNGILYCFAAFDAGVSLDVIDQEWNRFKETIVSTQQRSLHQMSLCCMKVIQCYRGEMVDLSEIEALLQRSKDAKAIELANTIRMSQMRTAYLFYDYERADHLARLCFKFVCTLPPTSELPATLFTIGLIALAMAGRQRKHRRWNLKRANKVICEVGKMARACPCNFLDKLRLLQAELAAARRKESEAVRLYEEAMQLANLNQFVHIQALANERCALFHVAIGKVSKASAYFSHAVALYDEWGARRKARQVQRYAEIATSRTPHWSK
jgi:histidine kinase